MLYIYEKFIMTTSTWESITALGIHFYNINDETLLPGNKACSTDMKIPYFAEQTLDTLREDIICSTFGCNIQFNSITELEVHKRAKHAHVCITCHAVFPTFYLLERHIVETHDSFFQIASLKMPMYDCLLEFCSEVFQTALQRKQHCMKVHKFPSDFRYDLQWRKLKLPKKSDKNIQKTSLDANAMDQTRCNEPRLDSNNDEMECVDNEEYHVFTNPVSQEYKRNATDNSKVPKSISFGIGVPRGFITKKENRKKHWHQKNKTPDTKTCIEQISMNDISQVLEDMES